MKITFKELVSGDEYQKHASEFCKALIFISVITSIINYIFYVDVGIFFIIIFFVVWSTFGVSILIGMPLYLLSVLAVVQMSSHTEWPSGKPNSTIGKFWKFIQSFTHFVGYGLAIYSTYFLIRYFK